MDDKLQPVQPKQQAKTNGELPKPAKKPYTTPKLVIYGDLGNITKSVSNMTAHADGGVGLTNKTN